MMPSFPSLEEKIVLVTGATRGIGRAIALSLATQKCHVVFNYRKGSEEAAKKLSSELLDLGAINSTALLFDITSTSQMKDAIDSFQKEFAPISGLVNNAGISKDHLLLRLNEDDLDSIINTNLKGSMMLTKILCRGFLKVKNASIVNISSIVGLRGNIAQSAYSASKAGLLGFTKSIAMELGSKNIRCNAVCPGFIETEMTLGVSSDAKDSYLSQIPLKRYGSPHEVAGAVCFLLDSCSNYITGEILKIDGGLYI